MNGINNNNISNSNYGFENNSNSNNKKDEDSIFDKVLDSISDFFGGEEEEKEKPKVASSGLDRAYMLKLQESNTYTLAPSKHRETLTEKWAKENENVELKQKEKEIAKLQQNLNTLMSKNKLLEKQNELMFQHAQNNTLGEATQQAISGSEAQVSASASGTPAQTDKNLPTHTSIPKSALAQQENEIAEVSTATKVEEPKKEESAEAVSAAPKTITEQYKEEVKA